MRDWLKRHWKGVAGITALLGLVLMGRFVPLVDWLERLAGPIREMGWLGVALYALIYFVAGMFCIPCMPITLAGGFILGTTKGVIAVQSGCMLAAAAGFLIGRLIGRRHAAEWLRKSNRFHFLDDAIAQEGWKIVGLLRMHPIPFGLSNYLYGMTKIDFWHYFLATAIAMLPGHLIYVHLASVGAKHLTGRGEIGFLEVLAPVLGIVTLVVGTVLLKGMFHKHEKLSKGKPEQSHA